MEWNDIDYDIKNLSISLFKDKLKQNFLQSYLSVACVAAGLVTRDPDLRVSKKEGEDCMAIILD